MFTKLNFALVYFYVMHLDLTFFSNEILVLFKDNIKYDFNINHVYYLHLLDPYGHVLAVIPFKLYSLSDSEGILDDIYRKLNPNFKKFLDKYDRYNPQFFIIYIGSNIKEYVSFEEAFNIKNLMNK